MATEDIDKKFEKLLDNEYQQSRDKVNEFIKSVESGVDICSSVNRSGIGNMTINVFLRTVARLYEENNAMGNQINIWRNK